MRKTRLAAVVGAAFLAAVSLFSTVASAGVEKARLGSLKKTDYVVVDVTGTGGGSVVTGSVDAAAVAQEITNHVASGYLATTNMLEDFRHVLDLSLYRRVVLPNGPWSWSSENSAIASALSSVQPRYVKTGTGGRWEVQGVLPDGLIVSAYGTDAEDSVTVTIEFLVVVYGTRISATASRPSLIARKDGRLATTAEVSAVAAYATNIWTTLDSYIDYFEDYATNNYQAARLANYRAKRLESWQESISNHVLLANAEVGSPTNGLKTSAYFTDDNAQLRDTIRGNVASPSVTNAGARAYATWFALNAANLAQSRAESNSRSRTDNTAHTDSFTPWELGGGSALLPPSAVVFTPSSTNAEIGTWSLVFGGNTLAQTAPTQRRSATELTGSAWVSHTFASAPSAVRRYVATSGADFTTDDVVTERLAEKQDKSTAAVAVRVANHSTVSVGGTNLEVHVIWSPDLSRFSVDLRPEGRYVSWDGYWASRYSSYSRRMTIDGVTYTVTRSSGGEYTPILVNGVQSSVLSFSQYAARDIGTSFSVFASAQALQGNTPEALFALGTDGVAQKTYVRPLFRTNNLDLVTTITNVALSAADLGRYVLYDTASDGSVSAVTLGSRPSLSDVPVWSASSTYQQNDLVTKGGVLYVCTAWPDDPVGPASWAEQSDDGVWKPVTVGAGSFAVGATNVADGVGTTAAGGTVHAEGPFAHAEGVYTRADGAAAHAEGASTRAFGTYTHAEGASAMAGGLATHAEGGTTYADGIATHAEGILTGAGGLASHAEGYGTEARGPAAKAEGVYATAGDGSLYRVSGTVTNYVAGTHAAGWGAVATNQTAFVWQGAPADRELLGSAPSTAERYYDHGAGTFSLNPVGGLQGIWIGSTNLYEHIVASSPPVVLPQKWALANVTNASGTAVSAADLLSTSRDASVFTNGTAFGSMFVSLFAPKTLPANMSASGPYNGEIGKMLNFYHASRWYHWGTDYAGVAETALGANAADKAYELTNTGDAAPYRYSLAFDGYGLSDNGGRMLIRKNGTVVDTNATVGTMANYVPSVRMINGHALSGDVQLGAADVGAVATNAARIAVGDGASATANGTIAVGVDARAANLSGIAIGGYAQSQGTYGISVGLQASTTNSSGVSIGYKAKSDNSSAAVGASSEATKYGAALGRTAKATGQYGVAIGFGAVASGNQSFAIGKDAKATHVAAGAIGPTAETTADSTLRVKYSPSEIYLGYWQPKSLQSYFNDLITPVDWSVAENMVRNAEYLPSKYYYVYQGTTNLTAKWQWSALGANNSYSTTISLLPANETSLVRLDIGDGAMVSIENGGRLNVTSGGELWIPDPDVVTFGSGQNQTNLTDYIRAVSGGTASASASSVAESLYTSDDWTAVNGGTSKTALKRDVTAVYSSMMNTVNDVKAKFYDAPLQTEWTVKIVNGEMKLYATTNVNTSVLN